ncbi:Y-family DNA polymerase [Idiomarina aquatica]|uniref:DNA polymerase DinP n=1 Tax=Idiomarina aquatica TaxID=1327752 RepID=A0AA94EH58_9GAMM|nr:DNA polymerase Y family protein [Idiomarina aquatica]RUO45715.1 DNA polymerase DinP [Idiomarina aquatica]
MSLWLYCHFPQLLMDTVCRIHPVVDDYPLAFYDNGQTNKETIVQCNAKAVAAGVEKGQSIALAQSLVPELICRQYSMKKEAQALQQLADKLYQSVDKQVLFPPQGIAIAVESLLRLYQGMDPLVCHLQEQFQAFELDACLSLAYSPEAAQCLAQAGVEQLSTDRWDIHQALADLPVEQFGWNAKRVEKLKKTGIKTLQNLIQIPTAQIGKRFGNELVKALAVLRGEQKSSVHFYQPAERFYVSFDLVTEIERWQGLLFPLKRALKELEQFLYQRQKAIRQLDITLHHREQQQTLIPLRLASDSWRASQFLQFIQLQVDRYPLKQPVMALSLRADYLHELDSDSGQLLADASRHQGDLPDLLSRLQARLGERAVYSPALSSDFRPLLNEQKQQPGVPTTGSERIAKRPIWLLETPQPIDIQHWRLIDGPERLHTGWWDEDTTSRDYWVAKDNQQRTGWLFYQQQWFLQGWFS